MFCYQQLSNLHTIYSTHIQFFGQDNFSFFFTEILSNVIFNYYEKNKFI